MHICFLTNEYPKQGFPHGGIGSFVKTIALELIKKNICVSVVGINYSNQDEFVKEDGVAIYRIAKSKVRGISWYLNSKKINSKLYQIHKDNPIDIVESAELGLAFINKMKGVKYSIRLHGGHHFFSEAENRKINWWKGFQEKKSFKKADVFIAVSIYVKEHTEKYLSFNNKRIANIPSPINTVFFKPLSNLYVKHKIVFVGTICEKKGIRQLIQAFPIIKEVFPDATLDIYGRDWFFKNGSSYIQMLKVDEEISDSISFKGVLSHDELIEKYAEANVCAFPSHMETQGLVALEAMSMAKPVLFTNLGPGKEAINDYETGLLCNPHNPNDIAEKIIWYFNNDLKTAEIGNNARKFVENKYGLENIVNKNLDFFNSII